MSAETPGPTSTPTASDVQGRLPWLRRDDLDADGQAFYDLTIERFQGRRRATPLTDAVGRFNGPYNPMLFTPAIGDALQRLGMALRFDGRLPRLHFEVIVLMMAVDRDAEYEWYAHEPVALREGLSEHDAAAIRSHDFAPARAVLGDAVFAMVEDCMAHRDVSDATYAAVVAAIGVEGVQEIVHTVAHYDEIALMMRVFRIPVPDGTE
jgi:4-carboxymuconolactone decarboxylase